VEAAGQDGGKRAVVGAASRGWRAGHGEERKNRADWQVKQETPIHSAKGKVGGTELMTKDLKRSRLDARGAKKNGDRAK